jgi:hypothetical protein
MARLKTFYTADEIINNLYTSGSEFMTEDNKEYIGAYHLYSTGERYTYATWNNKLSKRLIDYVTYDLTNDVYRKLKPNINVRYSTPRGSTTPVTKKDIDNGYIMRYFLQRINDPTILEVNQTTYNDWASNIIDKKMYNAASIQWQIAGNIEDSVILGAFKPGVITQNKVAVETASNSIPDLLTLLTDFTQFYTDAEYFIPVDINGLDS